MVRYRIVRNILYWIFALTLMFAVISPFSSCHTDHDTVASITVKDTTNTTLPNVTVILDAPTGSQHSSTRYPITEKTNDVGVCTFVLEDYANGSAFGVTLEVKVSGYDIEDGKMMVVNQVSGQYNGYDVEHEVIVK